MNTRMGGDNSLQATRNLADKTCMVSAAQSQLVSAQLAPISLGSQISTSVAAKTLSAEKQQGAAIVSLLDQAASVGDAPPSTGQGLDITA